MGSWHSDAARAIPSRVRLMLSHPPRGSPLPLPSCWSSSRRARRGCLIGATVQLVSAHRALRIGRSSLSQPPSKLRSTSCVAPLSPAGSRELGVGRGFVRCGLNWRLRLPRDLLVGSTACENDADSEPHKQPRAMSNTLKPTAGAGDNTCTTTGVRDSVFPQFLQWWRVRHRMRRAIVRLTHVQLRTSRHAARDHHAHGLTSLFADSLLTEPLSLFHHELHCSCSCHCFVICPCQSSAGGRGRADRRPAPPSRLRARRRAQGKSRCSHDGAARSERTRATAMMGRVKSASSDAI